MFEELQSLSEGNKKRVLVIGTAIIMVIVVGVWASYFNGIIAGASQPDTADATSTDQGAVAQAQPTPSTPASVPSGPSAWQSIENGMASIGNIFKQPSQYDIQPKSN